MASFPFLRTIEDLVVVAGTGFATWQSTKSASDVVAAVSAAPVVRSGLALLLTKGSSSGLVETISVLRRAVELLTSQPVLEVVDAAIGSPDPTAEGFTGKHEAAAEAVTA